MNHLIICPELPPAPISPGGIGTYAWNISRLLAEAGETVHVIGWLWEGAPKKIEESFGGRLIIHRVSLDDVHSGSSEVRDTAIAIKEIRGLRKSDFAEQCFSWQAALLAEKLVEEAKIDVIEAQEFQAPLYYLQLRRALGFGPRRHPPCIVHLHSPSEFIVRHNEWDAGSPYWVTAKRLENYTIACADARLCPSQFLAQQVETCYGIESGSTTVIPYPIPDIPIIRRRDEVWRNGTIFYFGRLEPRKGIIEFVNAAVSVADDFPSAQFEFVGGDLPYRENGDSVKQFVRKQIPTHMKPRFKFHGSCPPDKLLQFLAKARIAVVPSRWENFPNTCIEAMCSGLPVIASPNGGMAEMIKDNETGWLAENARSEGLAEALKRALETPSGKISEMGVRAASYIQQLCDNNKTIERHLRFRKQVAHQGAKRSVQLPVNLPWFRRPLWDESARRRAKNNSEKGLAIVVNGVNNAQMLSRCLQSIEHQTHPPSEVVLVLRHIQDNHARQFIQKACSLGWQVCEVNSSEAASVKNTGIEAVFANGKNPLAFIFLDATDTLYPGYLETCERVFEHCTEVGLVSSWMQNADGDHMFYAYPCPAFPYQLLSNATIPATAIRTEALRETELFHDGLNSGFEQWDIVNVVMSSGWTAVTVPELLSERIALSSAAILGQEAMYRELLAGIDEVVARDAQELIHLMRPLFLSYRQISSAPYKILKPGDLFSLNPSQLKRLIGKHLKKPGPAIRFLLWHANKGIGKIGARLNGTNLRKKNAPKAQNIWSKKR